ncbi:hypothetical protein G6F55_014572 [Rhizopus delemar]|nr:hypothetical protein G6F55_014572 [Rhizopus delemar]
MQGPGRAGGFFRLGRLWQLLLLGLPAVQQAEHQRVEHDRDQRAGQDQRLAFLRQNLQGHAEAGDDEGEFADLRKAGRDGQRGAGRVAEGAHAEECRR